MEMTITPSIIIPEILKKDNYKRWRILMRHYLEAQDLWDVVISNNIPSGVNEREWTKKNAAALLAIKISCEAKVFNKIEEMNSAIEVWDALADLHKPPSVSHKISQPQGHVSHEIEIVSHHKDVSQETKSVEPCAGPETNLGRDQYVNLRDLIKKGNDRGLDKFFEENPDARSARVLENGFTALHFAITIGRQRIAERLISGAKKKADLEIQDNNNNTPLSLAIRYGMKNVVYWLIEKNESLLLQPADAKKRIPVQLACNTGDERMTRYLYSKTPKDDRIEDFGFQLLEECITKKMFDIAFDLLQKFRELAYPLRFPSGSDSIPIILTLARTPPPFFNESRLIFWKRWIYKCTRVKAESIKQVEEEMIPRVDVYNFHPVLSILLAICCPWLLLLLIVSLCLRIFVACVWKTTQFIQQSLACARKIPKQSLACAWKILQQSLARVRKVTQQSRDEFRGAPKGVLLGMLKMLGVLLVELIFMPFTIVTVVAVGPISIARLILGKKIHVRLLEKEFECIFIADVLSELVSLFSLNFVRQLYDEKTMDEFARKVITLICQPLSNLDAKQFEQSRAVEATFHAIKNGIPEIVNEIERANANIFWSSTDPEGSGNIFACAVAHRQEKVAQMFYKSMDTDLLITTDEDGNNALHIAAKLAPHSQLGCIFGAALQLQSEVRWFKSVEGILPRFCNEQKNKNDKIPSQVFAEEHKNLLKDAEEWIKKTAESSTVVGALIITIMFAVAFTVPGGNDQETGYPIFLSQKPIPFMVFIASDAISLFTASSSVLMFLGILTSRYAYKDFLKSLPIKLIIGLSSLFVSIATMTTAFCAALFIVLQGRLEVVIPITMLACIPIAFFGWLQFPLLVEIYTSTFRLDIFEEEKESFVEMWYNLFCAITIKLPMLIMMGCDI